MSYTRIKHPTVINNEAKIRFLNSIKENEVYDIVEYEVWMNDDIYKAEECIKEELKEKKIELPGNLELLWFIEVAQFEIAKKNLLRTLECHALNEEEKADISFLNTCYPTSVAVKGALLKDFEL